MVEEETLRVTDIMTRDLELVDATLPVSEAAATMGDLGVGALLVGSADDLQGILTDRDILFRVVAKGMDSTSTQVGDVMSTTLFSCRQEDTVEASLDLMGARNIRRLPVLDVNGRLIGLVTLSDLAEQLLLESDVVQQALDALAEPPGVSEGAPAPA